MRGIPSSGIKAISNGYGWQKMSARGRLSDAVWENGTGEVRRASGTLCQAFTGSAVSGCRGALL